MAKKPFSIDLLVELVKHVPEGYLQWHQMPTCICGSHVLLSFDHLAHAMKWSAVLALLSQSVLIRLSSRGWILARDAPLVDVSFPFTIIIGPVRTATWIVAMATGTMMINLALSY